MLKLTNTTNEDVFVQLAKGLHFGRVRLSVGIDGLKQGRVHQSRVRELKLFPGESYTFFRQLSKPEKDEDVAFETPAAGNHYAHVVHKTACIGSFEFFTVNHACGSLVDEYCTFPQT